MRCLVDEFRPPIINSSITAMQKLIISIVTWNSAQTIEACLQSVVNQSFTDFTLYIVDNNSKDETASIIESYVDRRIKFFKKDHNTGFCGGHNFSIESTQSEFVLLVNPDIILDKNYVELALKTFEGNNAIGTVCGLLLQEDPKSPDALIDSAGLEIRRSRIMEMRFHGNKRSEVNLAKTEIFGADGALPLYRRAMINDISYNGKFFDEMFFAHKEDWDISWRSNIFGWKTVFQPDCVAVHPRHFKPSNLKLRAGIADHIKIHSVKNQLILLLKNESRLSFFKNAFHIIPRQVMIFFYILLFERTSLKAYKSVFENYSVILKKRRVIQERSRKLYSMYGKQ